MKHLHRLSPLVTPILFLFPILSLPYPAAAQQSISDYTSDLDRQDGFFPLHWDDAEGRLYLEIPNAGEDFLYLTSLATGVGSNSLGLDRGEIDNEYIARFDRVGPKALLVLQNPAFRVESNPGEALERSVEESFPTSTIGSFKVVAEEDGRLLVDATSFFLRDAVGIASTLGRGGGSYRVDSERSNIHMPRTRAFPENTEIEASLTFATDAPSWEVRRHSPDARAVTLRQHHSLVRLPNDGYTPRAFDPRAGHFSVSYFDYGNSFYEGYAQRYAIRHRLIKQDPEAAMSEPVEPIVYYLDPAVPEPYRSAFIEGGMWWNEVFEAAGFLDAFRIEDMPDDMDPMDARYNVIQWVHRTEAGSSIGPSFRDPRTGEIIKAAVRMDSHRSLVDYDLFAGAVAASPASERAGAAPGSAIGAAGSEPGVDGSIPEYFLGAGGSLDWLAELDRAVTPEEFAMARRRQHSAHEIGHTLGLAHNFIAISNGRASVMDYPAPLIQLRDGEIDLSEAYRPSAGAWDTLAIRYAYTEFPDAQAEEAGLQAIIEEAQRNGLEFITNPDNASSNSHPDASVWVNGTEVLEELERVMDVRAALIDRFGIEAIAPGDPLWDLNQRFVPVYLHHRFQLDAAIKTIGGMEYSYAVRGDPLPATRLIGADRVHRALDLLLAALEPEALAVPEDILELLAPQSYGSGSSRRAFDSAADPAFDQIGIARTLAESIVGGILERRRAARVVAFAARDPNLPSLVDVVGRLVDDTWNVPDAGENAALRRVTQRVVVDELIDLAANEDATVDSRAAAEWGLLRIARVIDADAGGTPEREAHRAMASADIERFLNRRYEGGERSDPYDPPPGTPIGSGGG